MAGTNTCIKQNMFAVWLFIHQNNNVDPSLSLCYLICSPQQEVGITPMSRSCPSESLRLLSPHVVRQSLWAWWCQPDERGAFCVDFHGMECEREGRGDRHLLVTRQAVTDGMETSDE